MPVGARVELSRQPAHRAESLLSARRRRGGATVPAVVGPQRRVQAGPPDPDAAAAVTGQMAVAAGPASCLRVGADRDRPGARGEHRARTRPEGADAAGHGVGGERHVSYTQLPGEGARQFGARGVAQGGEPGGTDDGSARPVHSRPGGGRAGRRDELGHQTGGIDAPLARADRLA
ncbi:hypothetical protein SRB17_53160 [Streptomyces sp. RB17]|nr:hypothetical protein [Streptomyces sp. RB17]